MRSRSPLTERQLYLLQCMAFGLTTHKRLAEHLGLSPQTIKAHLYEMFLLTGQRTKTGLVCHALRERWID